MWALLLAALLIAVAVLVLAAVSFTGNGNGRPGKGACGCRGRRGPTGPNISTQLIPYAGGPIVELAAGSSVPLSFAGFITVPIPLISYPPDDTLGLASRASWAAPFAMTLTRLTVSYRGLTTTEASVPVHAEVWVSPACSAPWQMTALVTTTLGTTQSTDACATVAGSVDLNQNDKVLLIIRPEGVEVGMDALAVSASIASFGAEY